MEAGNGERRVFSDTIGIEPEQAKHLQIYFFIPTA